MRFVAELAAAQGVQLNGLLAWVVGMNLLHYAIFMFVVSSLLLVAVGLMTPAPERRKLGG